MQWGDTGVEESGIEAVAAESTTTMEPTTTTEQTTTTAEPTTTAAAGPTPGKAVATGDRITGLDVAIGSAAPIITGHDYLTGEEIAWGGQGVPAAVLFAPLADWCPHCAEHVKDLAEHSATNEEPENAQVLLVTQRDSLSFTYPQDEWLSDIGWRYSAVLDNLDVSISGVYGVTTVPTWFLVDSSGAIADLLDGHHVSAADVFARIEALE